MADQKLPYLSEPVINIVLVGSTGKGKSATGNSILGHKMFISRYQAEGVTMNCEMYRTAIQDGLIINVIDTPALFDLSVDPELRSKEIINCLALAEEGIDAVLFVLSVNCRISQEEESTLNALQRIFESKILDYFIVVFTGGDQLEAYDQTLDDYLRQGCPEFLTRILRLCRGRKVLFDNRTYDEYKKAEQLKQLLGHVADIGKQNGGITYTDKLRRKIKVENEKLTEQESELEAKNHGKENLTWMKEKLRMQHYESMNMIMMEQKVENALKQSTVAAHEREISLLKFTLQANDSKTMKMMAQTVENALKQSGETHERHMCQLKDTLQLKNAQNMNMMEQMVENALQQSRVSHEREMCQLKDTLQLKDTETMNMMEQLVENALKQSGTTHEREMCQLKDTLLLKDTQTMNMMEQLVENALKQSGTSHETQMCQLKDTLLLKDTQTMNMMAQMSAASHEREMRQLKDTVQVKDTQTMNMMEQIMENALKQSTATHEREMRQLKDTLQQGQHVLPPTQPSKKCECGIM